jgi:hypothetical protein
MDGLNISAFNNPQVNPAGTAKDTGAIGSGFDFSSIMNDAMLEIDMDNLGKEKLGIKPKRPENPMFPALDKNATITPKQKEILINILVEYDPKNMTKEDWQSLKENLESAGFMPNHALAKAMREAGFLPPPMKKRSLAPDKTDPTQDMRMQLIRQISKMDGQMIANIFNKKEQQQNNGLIDPGLNNIQF